MSTLNVHRLGQLTITELKQVIRGRLELPHSHSQRKEQILSWILGHADDSVRDELEEKCREKAAMMREKDRERKRKRAASRQTQRKARRMEHVEAQSTHDIDKYLELPTDDELLQCFRDFIAATSNEAVKHVICGVCAREVHQKDDEVQSLGLDDIPNWHRLVPQHTHPAHTIYNGALLEPQGTTVDNCGTLSVHVCGECLKGLQNADEGPPPISLANDLWIGEVPWELQVLTVPEQLLIALVFPRIYVFKLYPKNKDFRPQQATLQRGMRGNVSTYEQDIQGISNMVDGRLMPQPLAILSSVLTVTYIGKGQLPKPCLHSTFRVRRNVIRGALAWLKANNPKYYGHIRIDEARLDSLPEDGVPSEIEDVIRHTTDIGVVDEESAGYVPDEDTVGGELINFALAL